jgi:hypothetical protein
MRKLTKLTTAAALMVTIFGAIEVPYSLAKYFYKSGTVSTNTIVSNTDSESTTTYIQDVSNTLRPIPESPTIFITQTGSSSADNLPPTSTNTTNTDLSALSVSTIEPTITLNNEQSKSGTHESQASSGKSTSLLEVTTGQTSTAAESSNQSNSSLNLDISSFSYQSDGISISRKEAITVQN